MRLSLLLSLLITLTALTSAAIAAGFTAGDLAALPWWEIALLAFPVLTVAFIRLAGEP